MFGNRFTAQVGNWHPKGLQICEEWKGSQNSKLSFNLEVFQFHILPQKWLDMSYAHSTRSERMEWKRHLGRRYRIAGEDHSHP